MVGVLVKVGGLTGVRVLVGGGIGVNEGVRVGPIGVFVGVGLVRMVIGIGASPMLLPSSLSGTSLLKVSTTATRWRR
jgi:hypothetical protein